MEILTNKAKISRDYLSRYANVFSYYNTWDKKYMMGLGSQLDTNVSYAVIDITPETTLDFLANKYYGRPDYFWIIADFNRIQDPFEPLFPKYASLKVPSISKIRYED